MNRPQQELLTAVHRDMHTVVQTLRLPFRSQVWQGRNGNWFGVGTGSSIDFQDYRTYQYGDDPRYIDWRAAARTEQYFMKLYREEVSPLVEVVIDSSASMFFTEAKARRTLELCYFALESALQADAAVHVLMGSGGSFAEVPAETLLAYRWPDSGARQGDAEALDLSRISWRRGSLRLVISDLLFPGSPAGAAGALASRKGRGILFVPFCREEAEPDWNGNVTFIDCEAKNRRRQFVDPALIKRYKDGYARHFSLWKECAARYSLLMARIPAETGFRDALLCDALPAGAVELCA